MCAINVTSSVAVKWWEKDEQLKRSARQAEVIRFHCQSESQVSLGKCALN